MNIKFNNTYSKLPGTFYQKINPSFVINPKLIKINKNLLKDLNMNLEDISDKEMTEYFSGNKLFKNSDPIAQVYAGHQFGHFSRRLGDGRAVLLGEILDKNNARKDIVLKGLGETIFSRGGDGRATLGSVIREYVMSESMYYLGVPTSRSLAIVSTGEIVFRENIHPGGILSRIASSHVRFGTFEYFFHNNDIESLKVLADYTISRHFSESEKTENKYIDFYEKVIEKQIDLVVNWMRVGFIHGVMNTDNMLISGETIDYGPCAFMDNYNKNTVFSSIDHNGRYSFMNQKYALNWNLARFGETLIPLMGDNIDGSVKIVEKILGNFEENFVNKFFKMMNNKIGIFEEKYFDNNLVKNLLEILENNNIDYTDFFRNLSEYIENNNLENIRKKYNFSEINIFLEKLEIILSAQKIDFGEIGKKMKKINPNIIPRNYKIEEVIKNAEENNDFSDLEKILEILKNPYSDNQENKIFMKAPENIDSDYRTFCGT